MLKYPLLPLLSKAVYWALSHMISDEVCSRSEQYLEGGPLMLMLPLYLHVNENSWLWYYMIYSDLFFYLQSTLVISKSKGLSEILWDIHISTYQNCRIKEKINWTTTFNKCICDWTWNSRYIENIVETRRKCSFGAVSPLFHNILLPYVRFSSLGRDQIFTLR